MAVPNVARDLAYQCAQLLVLAPASALVAKTETVSRFLPTFETLLNANNWKSKLAEAWNGTVIDEGTEAASAPFDFNPLSEANRDTVMVATTIAIGTATVFQLLRHTPGFRNSPKTSFALAASLSAAAVYTAASFEVIPPSAALVSDVFKNIVVVGAATTTAAKTAKAVHTWILGPTLNFFDMLNPVQAGPTGKPDRKEGHSEPSSSGPERKSGGSSAASSGSDRKKRSGSGAASSGSDRKKRSGSGAAEDETGGSSAASSGSKKKEKKAREASPPPREASSSAALPSPSTVSKGGSGQRDQASGSPSPSRSRSASPPPTRASGNGSVSDEEGSGEVHDYF